VKGFRERLFRSPYVLRFTFHERFGVGGSGTVNTGQPAVRTTRSAVLPKNIFSTVSDRPP
jgi:hypothetical protein